MANYPIFSQEGGQRIAINPERVISIIELEPRRILIGLPHGGSITVSMTLESVIARLSGQRSLGPE
jgi:hypothetical protein